MSVRSTTTNHELVLCKKNNFVSKRVCYDFVIPTGQKQGNKLVHKSAYTYVSYRWCSLRLLLLLVLLEYKNMHAM